MTKFDTLCELIANMKIDEDSATKIVDAMDRYRETYRLSYRGMMKSTVIRKLWDAIEEAAEESIGAGE